MDPDTLRMLKLTVEDLWETRGFEDDSIITKLFEEYEEDYF